MSVDGTAPPERISTAFGKLRESAARINEASDALAQPVRALQQSLQLLNLGVACWSRISGGEDDRHNYWHQDVGYARVGSQWCLAIRDVSGNEAPPEVGHEDTWPFNEAPRYLRIKAVDKLPDLIESMVEATDATAKRLMEKVASTQELAKAVASVAAVKRE